MPPTVLPSLARALATRRRVELASSGKTAAAVLVPLLAIDGALHLLYTRRSSTLPHHQGQVAFPGGTREEQDPDLASTALREASEEVGLAPGDVQILGALDDIETLASRFVITPFVGAVPHPYSWRLSPREVDAVFTAPVGQLADPETERQEVWDFDGQAIPIALYPVGGHVIWGATHRITRNLLAVLATLG